MNDLIGKELGPYRILEQIGAGGMATVYRAYHAAMDRHVAVKVLPEQMSLNAELRKRFDREAKVIAKLEHAHILPVHDYGQAGNRLYLVMRCIEAGTLKDHIATEPLELDEANRILHQVGGALAYAHRLGVVHRDVKPSNVLLDAQGDCYLTDFGLAKIMEASSQLTATGVGMGTPAYMSPEQGQGEKVDARSDIYSLGVMLYEMVTGQVPYQAETPMAVVLKHISAPLPLPRSVNPNIPEKVERVIIKAMVKNPDDRFQTVGEMVTAFDAAVRQAETDVLREAPVSSPITTEELTPAIIGPPTLVDAGVQEMEEVKEPGKTKKCPLCAEDIQAEAKVCRYCGARFQVSIKGYCPNCQAEVEVNKEGQCQQCGSQTQNRHVESLFLGEQATQPVPPGQPIQPDQSEQARELEVWARKGANAGIRFGAFFVDLIAITLISIVLVALLGFPGKAGGMDQQDIQELVGGISVLVVPVVWFFYFVILEGTFGTTLGKTIGAWPAASLKVIRKDGSRCGYVRAAIRAFLGLFETNLLGAIVIWVTRRNQRIGDLIAGTLVINTRQLGKITFLSNHAVFEFVDGRRTEISRIVRGDIQKWIHLNEMRLDGVTPDGRRVRWNHLTFPDAHTREQVWAELERFFQIKIAQHTQWLRLILVLSTLGIVILCIGGLLALTALPSIDHLPTLFPALASRTPVPRATRTRPPTLPPPTRPPRPATPAPTRTPSVCLPNVEFVQDVTIPDGTQFKAGEPFTKVWRVRSSGCAVWEPGTRWVFVSGNKMGAPEGIDVPDTPRGKTVDLSVSMRAPDQPGAYKSYWQMQGPDGNRFGDQAYVIIVVPGATGTPDTRSTISTLVVNKTGETLTSMDQVRTHTSCGRSYHPGGNWRLHL